MHHASTSTLHQQTKNEQRKRTCKSVYGILINFKISHISAAYRLLHERMHIRHKNNKKTSSEHTHIHVARTKRRVKVKLSGIFMHNRKNEIIGNLEFHDKSLALLDFLLIHKHTQHLLRMHAY